VASSIRPLSELPEDLVLQYFTRRKDCPELIRWKFFDRSFNPRGRERGIAWLRDGRVEGFLGLIPTSLGREGRTRDLTWTCDWSLAERTAAPGIGVRMLQRAMESNDHLMYVTRGSKHTASIASRLAQRTVADAGVILVLPLRLGALLEQFGRRAGFPRLERWSALARIPVRRTSRAAGSVIVEDGVSRSIAPLLEAPRGPGWYPQYDWTYLDWAVGRCPQIRSRTVYGPAADAPRAAALLWRRTDSERGWRMALWARPEARDVLQAVFAEAVRLARDAGGWLVSLMVSRLDEQLIEVVCRGRGVIRRPPQPLFILVARDPEVDEVGNLSFVDADLAYQF
jgi:hypothetical protein